MSSKEEREMGEIAEAIASFDLSNPILVEFFKKILHDPLIFQKDAALRCLLNITKNLEIPPLISQKSYGAALRQMEEMAIDLYVQEVNLSIEKIGQKEALWPVAEIILSMFGGGDKEKERIREYFGALLYMIRLERLKEKNGGIKRPLLGKSGRGVF